MAKTQYTRRTGAGVSKYLSRKKKSDKESSIVHDAERDAFYIELIAKIQGRNNSSCADKVATVKAKTILKRLKISKSLDNINPYFDDIDELITVYEEGDARVLAYANQLGSECGIFTVTPTTSTMIAFLQNHKEAQKAKQIQTVTQPPTVTVTATQPPTVTQPQTVTQAPVAKSNDVSDMFVDKKREAVEVARQNQEKRANEIIRRRSNKNIAPSSNEGTQNFTAQMVAAAAKKKEIREKRKREEELKREIDQLKDEYIEIASKKYDV